MPADVTTDRADAGASLCRDCLAPIVDLQVRRCPACHGPRLLRHPELHNLSIAHLDCDAFYAAIEKRDDPSLKDKPVIVGGGRRGVVSTCCYIARIKGVRSAMPMFKALKLCPDATVIKPDMEKYAATGRQVRTLMESLTPVVEPLSIDEAFMDLSGTQRLTGKSPAMQLAELALRIERDIGITVSIGLAPNKFLAKIASDLNKPRGFSVFGHDEAADFLAEKPVGFIWGVGKAMEKTLARDGITRIAQLQELDLATMVKRYGSMGARLHSLSRGQDNRAVSPHEDAKSISAETTFNEDIAEAEALDRHLWLLAEKVSRRCKRSGLAGYTVTLKLKTQDFRTRTRATSLADATQLASRIHEAAHPLLLREAMGMPFRLIGVGVSHLETADGPEDAHQLDTRLAARARTERAMDAVRDRFGREAVAKGLGFAAKPRDGD